MLARRWHPRVSGAANWRGGAGPGPSTRPPTAISSMFAVPTAPRPAIRRSIPTGTAGRRSRRAEGGASAIRAEKARWPVWGRCRSRRRLGGRTASGRRPRAAPLAGRRLPPLALRCPTAACGQRLTALLCPVPRPCAPAEIIDSIKEATGASEDDISASERPRGRGQAGSHAACLHRCAGDGRLGMSPACSSVPAAGEHEEHMA